MSATRRLAIGLVLGGMLSGYSAMAVSAADVDRMET
jgi:hypothetical protein